jgi:hypothetical protein|tara:strand:+ start:620 stop:775 length:156 start_codon:yes stop_codon:yes gene_type:complete
MVRKKLGHRVNYQENKNGSSKQKNRGVIPIDSIFISESAGDSGEVILTSTI